MKVLHVVQRYSPAIGGAEEYITGLSEELVRRGHTVDVYTSRALDYRSWRNELLPYEERNGVSVYRFNSIRRGERTFSTLAFAFRKYWPQRQRRYEPLIYAGNGPVCPSMFVALWRNVHQYDLVHIVNLHYAHAWPAYWFAHRQGVPIVVSPLVHTEQPHTYDVGYIQTILCNSQAILALTSAEKSFLVDFMAGPVSDNLVSDDPALDNLTPVVVSGVGLSTNMEVTGSTACDLSKIPAYHYLFDGDHDNKFIILFLARKVEYKGLEKCLEAWRLLRQQGYNVWLLALGPETEHSEQLWRQYAPSYTSSGKQPDGLVIRGMVSDEERTAAFALCDLFTLPSVGESFGIVYLEAWAYGKPVIGANIAAVSSLIQNGYDGILIDADQDEAAQTTALCQAIRYLIDNPQASSTLGKRGQDKLHERYTTEKIGTVVEETYAYVIHGTPLPIVQESYITIQQVDSNKTDATEEDYFMPESVLDHPLSDLPDDLLEIRDPAIDVENIMAGIRKRIEQRRKELGYDEREFPRFGSTPYPVKTDNLLSDNLPADVELQHHLQAVNSMYNLAETAPLLLPSPSTRIPIAGGLWKWIRRSAHELVLFYVNRYVTHQTSVNHHLVNGINQLVARSLEQQQQITELQQELEQLRADTYGND